MAVQLSFESCTAIGWKTVNCEQSSWWTCSHKNFFSLNVDISCYLWTRVACKGVFAASSAVNSSHNTLNILRIAHNKHSRVQSTSFHNGHPIAHSRGPNMGCLLWVQSWQILFAVLWVSRYMWYLLMIEHVAWRQLLGPLSWCPLM